MAIKFDSQAQNYARSRGLQNLPQESLKKLDSNQNGSISIGEAARAGASARLDSDGRVDAAERTRLNRLLGATPIVPTARTTNTTGSSHVTTSSRSVRGDSKVGLSLSADILNSASNRFTRENLERWDKIVNKNSHKPTAEKVSIVNRFFNTTIRYTSDKQAWKKSDYWATPLESLKKGRGDCDDFAIAKYVTLRKMGIPKEDLKLAYVYYTKPGKPKQAHMVLLHQPPGEKGTVLDNIDRRLKSPSERKDLQPVYSFNETGLWLSRGNDWSAKLSGTSDKIKKWEGVLTRMSKEGLW